MAENTAEIINGKDYLSFFRRYADRTKNFAGKIDHDDLCFKLFTQYGWEWGGDWQDYQDYQHFEKR